MNHCIFCEKKFFDEEVSVERFRKGFFFEVFLFDVVEFFDEDFFFGGMIGFFIEFDIEFFFFDSRFLQHGVFRFLDFIVVFTRIIQNDRSAFEFGFFVVDGVASVWVVVEVNEFREQFVGSEVVDEFECEFLDALHDEIFDVEVDFFIFGDVVEEDFRQDDEALAFEAFFFADDDDGEVGGLALSKNDGFSGVEFECDAVVVWFGEVVELVEVFD